ncbi:hypothetical protein ABBQ32_001824 [Trebouxia sp. C0010 RCD-2024]
MKGSMFETHWPEMHLYDCSFLSWRVLQAYLADQAYAERKTYLGKAAVERESLSSNGKFHTAQVSADDGSEADLLWYFAFGSNMDPDVLGRVRQVHPRQSQPCKVEGYVLTFASQGFPYIEPGFGAIQPLTWNPVPPTLTVEAHSEPSNTAEVGKATMYSTPSKAVADQLLRKQAARSVAYQDPQSPRPSSSANSIYGSPELPVSVGFGRSSAKRNRSPSREDEHNDHDLNGSHTLHPDASGGSTLLNGHKHVEVHGVVHQISQQDMAQICKTEGGAASADHGYYVEYVTCQLYNGETMPAVALLTHPSSFMRRDKPALPSERYLRILLRGAAHSQLASEYQVYLQALQHYHASKPGQRVGRFFMAHFFGTPLRFMYFRVIPHMHNKFLLWAIHKFLRKLMHSLWVVHDCLMEPVLGSGVHL